MVELELKRSAKLTPQVDTFYGMFDLTRDILIRAVDGLTVEQLDYTPDNKVVESIATLLYHIAAVEHDWIFFDIKGEEIDFEKWKYGFPLRDGVNIDQISGKDLKFYLDLLLEVRVKIFEFFESIDDEYLSKVIILEDGTESTVEWILFHIMEHELTHIGQIRLLKRLYKLNYKN
jgi:uncharacterized damage-inducible protein DinB